MVALQTAEIEALIDESKLPFDDTNDAFRCLDRERLLLCSSVGLLVGSKLVFCMPSLALDVLGDCERSGMRGDEELLMLNMSLADLH